MKQLSLFNSTEKTKTKEIKKNGIKIIVGQWIKFGEQLRLPDPPSTK